MRRTLIALAALLALTGAACGSGDNPALEAPTGSPEETPEPVEVPEGAIGAELNEWDITLGADSAPAGEVAFAPENVGTIDHDFVVIATDLPADELPEEEGQVDTEAEGVEVVGSVESIAPGATDVLTPELEPGSHVVICNIVGHYGSGMFDAFTAE